MKVIDVVYSKLHKWRSYWYDFSLPIWQKYHCLIISLRTFSITFYRKLTSSSSLCSRCFFELSIMLWIFRYIFWNLSTIFYSSISFSFLSSPMMSASYCIWLLNWAKIFFVISCVDAYYAWIPASKAFMEVYKLLNSLMANLQLEILLVFAEVS